MKYVDMTGKVLWRCCYPWGFVAPPAAASRSTCHPAAVNGARSTVDMCSSNIPSTSLINHHYPDTQLCQLDLPSRAHGVGNAFKLHFYRRNFIRKLFLLVIFSASEKWCISYNERMYLFCKLSDVGYLDTLTWEGLKVIDDMRTRTNHVSIASRNSTHLPQSMNHL